MRSDSSETVGNARAAGSSTTADWWRTAVIYQVYPRSFADGNGDGTGDLPGARRRLDHLADLGIDAVWLSPCYRSPMIDSGYDVADYRDIDPLFGTLADFDALLARAHELGLRVIIDLVPNHSSSAHPWFVEALAAPPGSAQRERYVFRPGRGPAGDEPPNDWMSVFGGPAWTRTPDGEWYLHLFDPAQPDFNWDHDEVRAEFESILRFWLDRGVDGFRIDVAHGLVKAPGLPDVGHLHDSGQVGTEPVPYFDQEGVHEIYRSWRKILDGYQGQRIAVAEAWVASPERTARYVAPDELHQAFNFHFLKAPWSGPALRTVIDTSLAASAPVGATTTWVLSNHDVQRHVTRYGGGEIGLRRARAAILLMLALPGSAYLYQGEELGLPEVLDLPDDVRQDPQWLRTAGEKPSRDGCRVPIPWSGSQPPFGFSDAEPPTAPSWLPAPASWASLTVQRQRHDPASMLSLYRRALALRRSHPALGANAPEPGTLHWLGAADGVPDQILAFRREPGLVCAVNLTDAPVEFTPPAPAPRSGPASVLLASDPVEAGMLPPDTTVWWSF